MLAFLIFSTLLLHIFSCHVRSEYGSRICFNEKSVCEFPYYCVHYELELNVLKQILQQLVH